MTDNVVIVSIKDSEILAVPMITNACINCEKGSCAKRGKPFPVSNPENFSVSVGSIVKVKANKKVQIVQGFVALFLPLLVAVGLFFLGGFLATKFSWPNKELIQVCGVLVGIIAVSVIVYFTKRKDMKIQKCEITQVVS